MQHEVANLRPELPRGTVTMMFTDIAGSTALLHQHGEGYRAPPETHRSVIRAVLRAHDGAEADTQTAAVFVAFARASDAARAALTLADALADGGPARGRSRIHTG